MMKTKTSPANHKKNWTDEELAYLKEQWGTTPIIKIANYLNRTTTSIQRKACRLGLGNFLNNGEYITFRQLLKALQLNECNSSAKIAWIKPRNFPIKYKKVNTTSFEIVYIKDFWIWAEQNQDTLDFSKLEPLILGEEPEWVDKKRKSDSTKANTIKTSDWTDYEDNQLINLVKEYRYTTKELSNILHRTESAILTRLRNLNIKYRPIPEDKHKKWTKEEDEILIKAIQTETNWISIAKLIPNHSEKAIKSKAYLMFKTQKLNKIKKLLSD